MTDHLASIAKMLSRQVLKLSNVRLYSCRPTKQRKLQTVRAKPKKQGLEWDK